MGTKWFFATLLLFLSYKQAYLLVYIYFPNFWSIKLNLKYCNNLRKLQCDCLLNCRVGNSSPFKSLQFLFLCSSILDRKGSVNRAKLLRRLMYSWSTKQVIFWYNYWQLISSSEVGKNPKDDNKFHCKWLWLFMLLK